MFPTRRQVHPASLFFFVLALSSARAALSARAGGDPAAACAAAASEDDAVTDDLGLLQTLGGRAELAQQRARNASALRSDDAEGNETALVANDSQESASWGNLTLAIPLSSQLLEWVRPRANVSSLVAIGTASVAPLLGSLLDTVLVAARRGFYGFLGNSSSSGGGSEALTQLTANATDRKLHAGKEEAALPIGLILVVLLFFAGVCVATSALASSAPRRLDADYAAAQIARARGMGFDKHCQAMPLPSKTANFGAKFVGSTTPDGTTPRPRLLPALVQPEGAGTRQSLPRPGAAPACATAGTLTPAATNRGSVGQKSGGELCPELIVPYDRQCCVATPSLRKIDALGSRLNGRIADKQGRTILLCDLDCSGSDFDGAREVQCERLAIRLPEDERLLAYADLRVGRRPGAAVQCALCWAHGVPYARFEEESPAAAGKRPSYVLRAAGDGAMLLRAQHVEGGLGRASSSWVFTESRGLTAASAWEDAIQDVEYARRDVHWVLVSSSVDVGLVVLSVMALDRMLDRNA